MLKKIAVVITAFVCAQVSAEPMKMASKAELSSAKSAVEGIISSGASADEVMSYAGEAKKSAEKYQLYCAAFKLYAKEGNAEDAANVIKMIQSEFIGVSDKDIVLMIEQNAKKLTSENAELGAVLNSSKARASAAQQLSKAKKDLKKNPNSVDLKYLVAESYAVLGDWKSALRQFKDAGGSVWQVASDELAEDISAKTAAFWWDYKPRSKFNVESAFKAHSVEIYEKLLKEGNLSVLEKVSAEKRIEQAASIGLIKPKSELDKLKKICNTKGLVHCWRFNDDLKDCITLQDTSVYDINFLQNGCYTSNGDNKNSVILARNILNGDVTAFTIEIWGKMCETHEWSKFFAIGDVTSFKCASWLNCMYGKDMNQCQAKVRCGGKDVEDRNNLAPFSLGQEFHVVAVYKETKSGIGVTFYKQDVISGKTLGTCYLQVHDSDFIRKLITKTECALLIGKDINCEYNEVRVWNRALSEEELTQNAIKFHKAGETMKK